MGTTTVVSGDTKDSRSIKTFWVIPTQNIIELSNPMDDDIWGCGVITKEDVLSCFDFHQASYPYESSEYDTTTREYNIARIAYIAEYELYKYNEREQTPISVEITLMDDSSLAHHPIIDGNHRVAAAHVLNEEFITIEISGYLDTAYELLCPVREFTR